MIISHKLKCIYIKNKKVAGSSFEVALSQYCGPRDIITSLEPAEENLRTSLGGFGAQNCKSFNQRGEKCKYAPHTPATNIKNNVSPDIWNNYLKIATIRCPYDAFVSWYYFCRKLNSPRLDGFIKRSQRRKKELKLTSHEYLWFWMLAQMAKISAINVKYTDTFESSETTHKKWGLRKEKEKLFWYKIMHVDGNIAADFLIRYEHLNEDIKKLEEKINCPGLLDTFQNINANKNMRPRSTASYEMYAIYPKTKLMIDRMLYEGQSQYEFIREYGLAYKSRLEETISHHKKSTYFKLKCLLKKVLFQINSIVLGILINKYTEKLLLKGQVK